MSEKKFCPACESYTSSLAAAFRKGEPCPYCGLAADVAAAVEDAREHNVSEKIIERAINAEKRASEALHRARRAESALTSIRNALAGADEFDD